MKGFKLHSTVSLESLSFGKTSNSCQLLKLPKEKTKILSLMKIRKRLSIKDSKSYLLKIKLKLKAKRIISKKKDSRWKTKKNKKK